MLSVKETWEVHIQQVWAVAFPAIVASVEASSTEADNDDSGDESDDQDAELEFAIEQFEGKLTNYVLPNIYFHLHFSNFHPILFRGKSLNKYLQIF